jgi:hypothetical protein
VQLTIIKMIGHTIDISVTVAAEEQLLLNQDGLRQATRKKTHVKNVDIAVDTLSNLMSIMWMEISTIVVLSI